MNALLDLDFSYYYQIYTTIHKMMETRGYSPKISMMIEDKYKSKMLGYIGDCNEEPLTFLDRLALTFIKDNCKIYVYFFILNVKMKKADIEHIYKLMQSKNMDKLLLILKEKLTPKVSSILKTFSSQFFYEKEMIIDPTNHILQPKFQVLTESEKKKILDFYKTDIKFFPGIFKDQIIAKWFDLETNDVLKITRKNGEIYYRAVRNS